MKWLHVTNNTGNALVIQYNAGAYPITVQPGRWCFGWTKEPHCRPKVRR
jgi:hypothetical protein